MGLHRLENVIQPYAWGSRTALAQLLGTSSPSPAPQAELWMGAHPSGPSRVSGARITLVDLIEEAPDHHLGEVVARAYGARLPFLFKVLAAAEPLSLQAHPSPEQAREGFAREESLGIPREALHRNYRDDNHKPELLCALSRFEALCGFRPADDALRVLEAFALEGLDEHRSAFARNATPGGLACFFEGLFALDTRTIEAAVRSAARAAERIGATPPGPEDPLARQLALAARWTRRLAELHPTDPGVVAALLLHFVELEPGQALYLPAGNLHAYLEGTGLEIMASSDNVLRGGLTSKHVDVPELLRVLRFEPQEPIVIEGDEVARSAAVSESIYRTPAPEFCLSQVAVSEGGAFRGGGGPEILLGLEGELRVSQDDAVETLESGQSLFTSAEVSYAVTGQGRLARARVNPFVE